MAIEDSLNQSMDKAVKHYSSLFRLPSYRKMLLVLALSYVAGASTFTIAHHRLFEGFINGLLLGSSLFVINLTLDYFVSKSVLGQDPIYDLRRTTALSLFCWALWLAFILVGVAISMWIEFSLLGFSAVLIFRLVVFNSTSSSRYEQLLVASLLQPLSCVIPFLVLWDRLNHPITLNIYLYFVFSLVVGLLSSFLFLFLLNRVGEETLEIPSLPLFKAFLLNWIVGLKAPLEDLLEKLGEEQNVKVFMMKFVASKPKAVIAVPCIHPGPFKNVGSSLLPSMLKTALEKKLDCVAGVPHGLLGHELDLCSHIQNEKIISHVIESVDFKVSEAKATAFVKVSNNLATACCQIFGKSAFLSFTLAPQTTEDLPQELGLFVDQVAEKCGLTQWAVVNAHNSINGTIDTQEALKALKAVAADCLEQASSLRRLPFEVGAATVMPKEFNLKDGMGPGGIAVIVIKVDEKKSAYVIVDGNNMVSGMREKIIATLQSIDISEGEIFTTDTHSVNAITLSERGYHPIGEVIDPEKMIDYIRKATLAALSDLELSKAGARNITVSDVKVIGATKLEVLCRLTYKALQKAKRIAIPIFASAGLLLMLFLMLFIA